LVEWKIAPHGGISANLTGNAGRFAGFLYAQHGRHLYGESPEWGLASAYH